MGELVIRLKDAKLLEALEQMAALRHQPLEAEIEALLAKAVADHAGGQELVLRSREIRAMTPKHIAQTDSVEIIRQMREERMRDLGG